MLINDTASVGTTKSYKKKSVSTRPCILQQVNRFQPQVNRFSLLTAAVLAYCMFATKAKHVGISKISSQLLHIYVDKIEQLTFYMTK